MSTFWKYAYFSDIADPSEDNFRDVLEISRRNNLANGLTGILVRDKKSYFQFLEGRKEPLAECVLRICGDRRHNYVTVVFSAQAEALYFDGWSLAVAKLPQRKQNLSAFKRLLLGLSMKDRIAMVEEVCLSAKLGQ